MNKQTLIRYINEQASAEECEQVMQWSQRRPENMQYLMSLINRLATLPVEEKVSGQQFRQFEQAMERKSSQTARIRKKRSFRLAALAAAAILILAFVTNIRLWQSNDPQSMQSLIRFNDAAGGQIQEIYVARGEKDRIELPDGSVVWLNSDSRISFPQAFSTTARCVTFSGEAYFDVVKNPDQPMIVTIDDKYSLKVLGTEFNVKSYQNTGTLETTLYSGKVDIYRKNESDEYVPLHRMKPSETYIINTAGPTPAQPVKTKMKCRKIKDIICWKDGILNFENVSLKDAFTDIERWYDIRIEVQDPEILNRNITARFSKLPVEDVLERIGNEQSLDFIGEGNIFIVRQRE